MCNYQSRDHIDGEVAMSAVHKDPRHDDPYPSKDFHIPHSSFPIFQNSDRLPSNVPRKEVIVRETVGYDERRKPRIAPVGPLGNFKEKEFLHNKAEPIEDGHAEKVSPSVLLNDNKKRELGHNNDVNDHSTNDHKCMQPPQIFKEIGIRVFKHLKSKI